MTDHNRANDLDRIRTLQQAIAYRNDQLKEERALSDQLADALRFHEDRRANPTSRGGPALAAYDEARA